MKPIRTEKDLPLCGTVPSNVDVALSTDSTKYVYLETRRLTFSQDNYVRKFEMMEMH